MEALRPAAEAARLAPHDGLALSLCSGALTLSGRLKQADRLIERAVAMDPWSPWGWVRAGLAVGLTQGTVTVRCANCISRCA
jgi:hypothetical protein